MALKPAQPKVEKQPIAKPLDQKPIDQKPVDQKPIDVNAKPIDAPVDGAASVVGEPPKKKPDWNKFSSVAMSNIPVSTPMRGSVLSARIEVLKKPKPAPVAEESDE